MRPGDIYLADVGEATRERVVVVSDHRFNLRSGRALIAPETNLASPHPPPWRIAGFALDRLNSIPLDRLLELQSSLSAAEQRNIAVAMRRIAG